MSLRLHNAPTADPARPAIECAQCGEHLFMPEWSEYLDAHRARHLWCCEACGYKFETTVHFATVLEPAR